MKKGGLIVLLSALMALVFERMRLSLPQKISTRCPRPSTEYESLQDSLEQMLDKGYEYSPPASGSYTQAVQLRDLNGDGIDEAVAFFRDGSGRGRVP